MDLLTFEKTVKAQLHERANSPLFGTFFISWCIWNYKFLVVLFSSANVKEKITLIETVVFPNTTSEISIFGLGVHLTPCLTNGLLYPLAMTISFIFIYPWPAMWVLRAHGLIKNKQKKIQIKNDNEMPISQSEVNERTDSYLSEIEFYKSKMAQYQKDNLDLSNRINTYEDNGGKALSQTLKIAEQDRHIRELSGKEKLLLNKIITLSNLEEDARNLFIRKKPEELQDNSIDELFMHGEVNLEIIFTVLFVSRQNQINYKDLIPAISVFFHNAFVSKYFIEKAIGDGLLDESLFDSADGTQESIIKASAYGMALLAKQQNKTAISEFSKFIDKEIERQPNWQMEINNQ